MYYINSYIKVVGYHHKYMCYRTSKRLFIFACIHITIYKIRRLIHILFIPLFTLPIQKI